MSFISWLWCLVSDMGLLIRRGHSHGRIRVMRVYLKIELKRFFLARLMGRRTERGRIQSVL